MRLSRVCGNVVSTVKAGGLASYKLLVIRDVDPSKPQEMASEKDAYIAVDLVGAGDGDVVLVVHGSAARVHPATGSVPTDAAVVAIVDSVLFGDKTTFMKS